MGYEVGCGQHGLDQLPPVLHACAQATAGEPCPGHVGVRLASIRCTLPNALDPG